MRRLSRRIGLCLGLLSLYACAQVPAAPTVKIASTPPVSRPAPPLPAPEPGLTFADLVGWDQEDHADALDAFRAGCGVARDPAWREVCQRARDLGPQDEVISRAFFETNFRLQAVGEDGLLTGYFAPEYPARHERDAEFSAPVRARPDDLVVLDLSPFDAQFQGKKITGRIRAGKLEPYPDRKTIERSPADGALGWMRPEDLFFLQIQGSGVLTFADGSRQKALFAAGNGRPFVGIAAVMRDQGLLADGNTSGDAIRAWLAAHRGKDADAVMQANPHYVFFSLQPDDGQPPVGASGAALTPGRALAVDPAHHRYGALYWISAQAPALAGAFPVYRRLALALDTGTAIKGVVRADLYLGQGDKAGAEAGRIRHRLTLVALTPVVDAASPAAAVAAVAAPTPR